MNELLIQNATSIPSRQIRIPLERLLGQNKKGFGSSSIRLDSNDSSKIVRLLSAKFSNIQQSKKVYSQSFYSTDYSTTPNREQEQTQKQKQPVIIRTHIPMYKSHYAEISLQQQRTKKNGKLLKLLKHPLHGGIKELMDDTYDINNDDTFHKDEHFYQDDYIGSYNKGEDQFLSNITTDNQILRNNIKSNELLVRTNLKIRSFHKQNEEQADVSKLKEREEKEDKRGYSGTLMHNKFSSSVKYNRTHNSAFKSIPRENLQQLFERNKYVPGPGDYEVSRIFENSDQIKNYDFLSSTKQSNQTNYKFNLSQIKKQISTSLNITKNNEPISSSQLHTNAPNNQESYMFAKDDRDRFGKQIYPLSGLIPVPGPGQYEQNQFSLSKRAEAVNLVQEQKKLLKVWLHPNKQGAHLQKEKQPKNNSSDSVPPPILITNY